MLKSEDNKTVVYLDDLKEAWGMHDNNTVMQITQLTQLNRIADALENIHSELVQANAHLVGLDDLAKCTQDTIGYGRQLYINGTVANYEA